MQRGWILKEATRVRWLAVAVTIGALEGSNDLGYDSYGIGHRLQNLSWNLASGNFRYRKSAQSERPPVFSLPDVRNYLRFRKGSNLRAQPAQGMHRTQAS